MSFVTTMEQIEEKNEDTINNKSEGSIQDMIELVSSTGETFTASRDFLSRYSYYFRGLVSSGMKESVLNRVSLPTVSSQSLGLILEFINGTSALPLLDMDSVTDLMVATNYLQMPSLMSVILSRLENILTVQDCYAILTLGQDLMIPSVVKHMEDYIKSHFEEFIQTTDFASLNPQQVIEFLSADDVLVHEEITIFNAVLHWFDMNSPLDKYKPGELRNMIQCVRFGLLTKQERQLCMACVATLPEAAKQVVSAADCFNDYPARIHRERPNWYKIRHASSEACLILTGGFTKKSESSTNRVQLMAVKDLDLVEQTSKNSSYKFNINSKLRLPEPLCEHSTCVIDNYLYVAGGQRNYCVDGRSTQNSVWRFDPRTLSWLKVCSMNKPRSLFCLLPLDGSMYAVCGWLEPERVNRTVERYDPERDSWHYVAPIVIGLHEHAGCSYHGYLYVSGGYKGPARGHLDQLWMYDPSADVWSQLCPMYQARSYHCMVALEEQNKLAVIGGVCSNRELFNDIQNCELYDPKTNQWTTVCEIPLPASCMPCLLYNKKLYLFGGHAFQEGSSKHSSVQILDTETWTWQMKAMDTAGILCSGLNVLQFRKHWLRESLNR